ncbi:MAG TPA: hypothetical protein PLL98_10975 [Bacillota bacterium]|nr:hypothetical protein [Bacillota bacterium]
MKKTLLIFCICILSVTGCGLFQGAGSDFTIKITGSEGLTFSGHYAIVVGDSLPDPINVRGTAPAEYKGKGVIAICFFRKLTEQGTLKVEIVKDDKTVSESETSIPNGFVFMKTPLPEKNMIIAQLLRKLLGGE